MMHRDARISKDGLYRYRLEKTWDDQKPKCLFVILNSSTADGTHDDATIRCCIRFAQDWGYGALLVGNLFAYRSTDPGALVRVEDPIGPDNDRHLEALASEADKVVAAWGGGAGRSGLRGRDAVVLELLTARQPVWALRLTKDGHPMHPGRQPRDLQPFIFREQEGRHDH